MNAAEATHTSADLDAVIALFAEQHPEFATAEGADGCCGWATDLFIEMAEALGVTVPMDEVHFTSRRIWARELPIPTTTPCFPYSKGPALFHGGLAAHDGHIVVRIGRLCIDWTARQFREDAPFPFIFPTPEP